MEEADMAYEENRKPRYDRSKRNQDNVQPVNGNLIKSNKPRYNNSTAPKKFNNNDQKGEGQQQPNNNSGNKDFKKKPFNKKPEYVKMHLRIGESRLYNDNISELYNILDQIPFDKVSIPVYMTKSALFGENGGIGTLAVGRAAKLVDDTFTVLINSMFADKVDEEKCVIFIRCSKNYKTGEFTFIENLNIVEGKPMESDFDDLEALFTKAEAEDSEDES